MYTKFSVYTDGSSSGKSEGAIGWGWIIVLNDREILCSGADGEINGTNNIAELKAVKNGLISLMAHATFRQINEKTPFYEVEVVSDSQYVLKLIDGIYKPKQNISLVKDVCSLCKINRVKTRWVRGHSGNPLNEMCDKLAKHAKEQYCSPKKRKNKNAKSNT